MPPGPHCLAKQLQARSCKTNLLDLVQFIKIRYKSSIVTPLYKKYSPVSLNSHVIKIFERVIRKQLVTFLESNTSMGFVLATVVFHNYCTILMMCLKTTQEVLILTPYILGLRKGVRQSRSCITYRKVVNRIRSFLSDRSQQIVIEFYGHLSLAALIISGVPQGTVQGSIRFLIFINDISHCIKDSTLRCFADETRISKAITCEGDTKT